MPSPLKSETARRNGARSRGPKTPEGRARSARNATRHGLTAASAVLLDTESREQFEAFRQSHLLAFAPRNQLEACLVEQFVTACWRLFRVRALETALLEPGTRQVSAEARALAANPRGLELLWRYESRYGRACQAVLETLARLKNSFFPNEPNAGAPPFPPDKRTP